MKHESIENNLLAFGMHEQALTSKDRFDAIALPELHHAAKLVSHHPEHFAPHFWRDVVPLQEEYVWPFTLTTVNNESVELQWDNKPFQNSRSQLLLYDAHAERLVDMRTTKSYTTSGNKVLEFIFTSDQKYSLQRELGKAFPNPFVQHVSLPAFINTQGSASITLTVKGLSGVEVYSRQWETKNEGLIQPEWKGVDGNGQSVSPGVYIYQITYSNDKHTVTSYGKLIKQ